MKKNKVYIGPANTSNVSKNIQDSLRKVGVNADFIPWSNAQHSFYNTNIKTFRLFNNTSFSILGKKPLSIINTVVLRPLYFLLSLIKYDTFIFIKPTTFFLSNIDLKILKFFNRKIVMLLVGCNDRDPTFSNNPYYVCNLCVDDKIKKRNNCNDLQTKQNQARFFEKYSSFIFGVADLVSFLSGPSLLFKIPMQDIKVGYQYKSYIHKLKIIHLPSNPLVKGTSIIEPILKRIGREEDVEIIIKKESWSLDKMIQTLESSHILIDSLAEYTFGKLSLEAIQYGCVPLNAYPDWIAENYDIPPVVKVDEDTLYDTLKLLIADRKLLQDYAKRSQDAFNKYFTYEAAGNYYKEKLKLK